MKWIIRTEPSSRTVEGVGLAAARLLGLRVRIRPGVIDVCLLCVVCCQVEISVSLSDHSTRGVLPSVMCLLSLGLEKEKALAYYGLLGQGKRGGS